MKESTEINNEDIVFERFFLINRDFLCITDLEGTFIKLNNACESTLGYTEKELKGRRFLDFVHPEDYEVALKTVSDLAVQGQVLDFTNRYKCKDGSYRFIEWRFQRYENRIYASARDVTAHIQTYSKLNSEIKEQECFEDVSDRLKVEQLLKESEERYAAIVNNAPEIVIIHKKGNVIFVNNSGVSIAGFERQEMIGKSILDFLTGDSKHVVTQAMKRRESGEKVDDYEIEFVVKAQSILNVIVKSIPISYEKEDAILAVLIDITEQKKHEIEMIKKENILTAVAASIRELLDVYDYYSAIKACFEIIGRATDIDRLYLFENDYDSNGKGRTSQKIEWNSGVEQSQIDSKELQDIPFETIEGFIQPLKEGNAFYGMVKDFENDRTRGLLEGQNILSIVVFPIFVNEVFWGFIGFDECKYERVWTEGEFSTLSAFANSIEKAIERRLIEEELELAKTAAECASVLKSRFLANMSHEIRTPMNGMLGYIDLLQRTSLSLEQKEYIREAKTASEMLLYLINDILDFSKIEAGRMTIERTSFKIRKVIEDAISIFLPKVNEKHLDLQIMVNLNVPEEVVGDPARLRQIINNLVSNAVKFTEKGEITLLVNSRHMPDGRILISFEVKDTGVGISEDSIKELFKPFTQADSSTTRKFGGTGLGLAISRELVKLMDGEISVKSILGQGSVFKFSVQMEMGSTKNEHIEEKEYKQITAQYTVNEEKDTLKPKILLVEDNEMNRKIVIKMLKHHSLTCDIVIDGVEALKAVSENDYDIVFMDCQMPVMDGYESTEKIRKREGNKKHTTIIAMTANAMQGDRKKCIDAGMDDYISKPLDFEVLFKMIEKYSKKEKTNSFSWISNYIDSFVESTGLDEEDVKRIFLSYIDYLPNFLEGVKEAILDKDFEKVGKLVHQLKGSSGNLRITSIYKLAIALEKAALNNEAEKCEDLLSKMQKLSR